MESQKNASDLLGFCTLKSNALEPEKCPPFFLEGNIYSGNTFI